jgi:hypothetical protein
MYVAGIKIIAINISLLFIEKLELSIIKFIETKVINGMKAEYLLPNEKKIITE